MKKILLNERLMLILVLVNMIVIFVQGCGVEHVLLASIDVFCTIAFVAEMVVKHVHLGAKGYWRDGWNALDGTVTLLSVPSVLMYFLPQIAGMNVIITLRALRVFKSFRAARHFPNIVGIWSGFRLALRQSAGFLLGYLVIIVVLAMFNSALFGRVAPGYFSTPLDAIYSVFRLFTVEGWYEIPNAIAAGMPPVWVHIVRLYFSLLLIGGGIIGMSLINSIFVDALAADNNDDVKAKLEAMERRMADDRQALESKIDQLQQLLEERG
jgi:voltage-gated sodium channel